MAVLTSPDFVIADGVSSATVGLYVDTPPVVPLAEQRVTQFQTGIDADYFSRDDVFEPIRVTIPAYVFFRTADFNLSEIYAFFVNAKKIQLSRFSDRYLKIRSVAGITPAHQWDGQRIRLSVQLICDPFKYFTANEPFEVSDPVVTNPGTRYSRPVYKITHSGACQLVVNNQHLKIYSTAPSPIFIDAERMFAYSATNQNATADTEGLFPFLEAGENTVYTTGDSSLEITGNWRDY